MTTRKKIHSRDQITAFLEELKTQTDRGAAVIAAAVLEELMELVILARLIEISGERREALFGRMAPLSSFSAKIELAFALGIINKEARQGLHLVRDVRNKLAHRIEAIAFDRPDVAKMIEAKALPTLRSAAHSPRERFIGLFSCLAMILYGTLAADIRIKSLEETHQDHFLAMMMEILRFLEASAAKAGAQNQSHETGQPKPE